MSNVDEALRSIEEYGEMLGRAAARRQLGMKAVAAGFARGVAAELAATTTTPGSRAEAPEARVEVGGELEGTAAGGRTDHPTPAAGASSSAEEDTDWIPPGPLADAFRQIIWSASAADVAANGRVVIDYVGYIEDPRAARALASYVTRVRWTR